MDCMSLYKSTKSTGNYWTNAVKFTVCNISLGIEFLKSLDSKLEGHQVVLEQLNISISNHLKHMRIETVNFQFAH